MSGAAFIGAVLAVLLLSGMIAAQTEPAEPEEDAIEERSPPKAGGEGWSVWSSWSPCSRSCNGGVTYSLRKCEHNGACEGESKKYRICNMQACPDPTQDFRAAQCSAYNPVPYNNRLYEWLPYQDPEDPCGLTCHARGHSFVAKLAPSVRDGTRCRDGSLDMCVDGECLAVGCDLQLGSEKRVDECGVCGGDGSSCRRPLYVWSRTPFSPCSVSCGGGYQMSRPTCLNKANEKEVDERLCDVAARPLPQIKECNPHKCPPMWVTDSWSPCSSSCGGGSQSRQVHCAQSGTDGLRVPVAAEHCQARQKPLTERPCNLAPCPRWVAGPWSGCSVTCGQGQKSRSAACRDSMDQHSEDCDMEAMPKTRIACDSGLVCAPSEDPGTYLSSDDFKRSQEDGPPLGVLSKPVKPKKNAISTQPSYVVGEWGPCSVTCGRGLQTRTVECKILLDFSRTVATIKDHECPILRPPNVKSCYPRPCSFDLGGKEGPGRSGKGQSVGIEVTYSWKDKGFTPCSASCLGGTRESVIQCLRDHDQAVVKPSLCDITLKPDAITQTCNDMPCPPKWNVTDYGECSKPCGGGLMRRRVQCLHEMIRGADNTLVVEADKCPPPKPQEEMFCNVFDCPYHWKADPWSKCSKSCNGGYKTRKIHCMKEMAFGQVLEFAPSDCTKVRQPKIRKPCNAKPCPTDDIVPSRGTYVQQHPQRRVFLKVGGTAVVFAETNLKIRCPSRNHNKSSIAWYKNDQPVEFGKRVKISLKGALRIRRVSTRDSGKYSCVSGFARADIHITVKPLPVEENTVENLRPPFTGVKEVDRTIEEKLSHEHRRPDHPFVYPKPKVTQKPRADNSAQDTFEDNRRQYHYKTNIHRNQDSHQDFGNKGKPSSTEDTVVEFSTLGRIPLYIQARQTTKPQSIPVPTEKIPIKTSLDSDELLPNRDFEKSWQKHKTKVYSTSEEKSPNQVLPPRYGDTYKQTYDGSLVAKKKPKEVWHKNDGDLFSDQEELNVGTPHGGKGFPGKPAHSGASSTHGSSHIKNLLMNLPSLGTTRGLSDDYDPEVADEDDEDQHPTKMAANSFVLGRGSAENLQFDWVITEWSECSQTCGGNGFQVRAAQCLVRLNNVSRSVDGSLCEDAGLPAPTTLQSCGHEDCPHWVTEPWSQCLETQCFRWQYSYERRAVLCRAPNGTDLPLRHCDEKTRPRRKRECYNHRCTAEWRVAEWSECTAACGRPGFQSRILQCVWHGGTRPAGNACRDQQRPLVMRPCRGKPCQSSASNCTDRSSSCSLARTLHLCRLSRYYLQCCDSCRYRGRKHPPTDDSKKTLSTDDSTL